MKTLLIGDVHGLVNGYWKLLNQHKPERSIQLGDFGFRPQHEWHRLHLDASRHKVLFGNHDDPGCLSYAHSLGDWGYEAHQDLFWVRGAESYDRAYRAEGRDWWPNEELTYFQMQEAIDRYASVKPAVVLTHDCPQSVRQDRFGIGQPSRTSQGLQAMLEAHQPNLWVFGHHHLPTDDIYGGTRFVCLDELGAMWVDL